MCGVLDNGDPKFIRDRTDRCHIDHLTAVVHRDHRANFSKRRREAGDGFGRSERIERFSQCDWRDAHRCFIAFDEHRDGIEVPHHLRGRREGHRRNEYELTALQADRLEGEV